MSIKITLAILVLISTMQVSNQYHDIKKTLGVMHMNYENQFDIFHKEHSLLLVAFVSSFCDKCSQAMIAMQDQINKIKGTPFEDINFAVVDVSQEQSMAMKYGIRDTVPQFFVFGSKSDKELFRMPASYSFQDVLRKLLNMHLARQRMIEDL